MWKHKQNTNKLSIWIYRTEATIFPYHKGDAADEGFERGAPFFGPGHQLMDQAGPPWTVLPCATPKAIELKRGSRYTTFSQHPTQPSLLKAEYKTNSPDAERIPPWKEIITNRRSKQRI